MKKIIYLFFTLLISTTIFPIFDISPWIVIENKTKLDFVCKVEIIFYEFDNEKITLLFNQNDNAILEYNQLQDQDGNEYIKFIITIDCMAQQAKVLQPIFYKYNDVANPSITSVSFTNNSLQITAFADPLSIDHRYFSIESDRDGCMFTTTRTISMYIKCLSNLKQTIQNIIIASLNATSWLPY